MASVWIASLLFMANRIWMEWNENELAAVYWKLNIQTTENNKGLLKKTSHATKSLLVTKSLLFRYLLLFRLVIRFFEKNTIFFHYIYDICYTTLSKMFKINAVVDFQLVTCEFFKKEQSFEHIL